MGKRFYITTPIYYVNDVPHIGHTCTTIFADIVARYHRLKDENVFFLTGTDEHGAKITLAAKKAGLSPQEFCDQISPRFKKVWQELNISHDFFIRTTDPKHEKIVGNFLEKIYEKGDIYKGTYQGLYCIGCEKFLTESDLKDGHCPLHPPELTVEQKEENWFFKLAKYIPKLIKLIEDNKTNYIFPENRRKEVLARLKKEDIRDISISRASVPWGIPIPWDKEQTTYVWFDALINYYSATQFVANKKEFWPANVHLLAKDILWFHTVIWQAMLLSTGLSLPQKTFIHSYYIMKDQKMSKSLGNLLTPKQLIDLFGVDGTRYVIASSLPLENDANVSVAKFIKKYNADLANGLGNLVSRTAKLCEKNNFVFKKKLSLRINGQIGKLMEKLNLPEVLNLIWNKLPWSVAETNKAFNEKKIWELKGDKLKSSLNQVVENILTIAYHIKPFLPKTGNEIEKIFIQNPIKTPSKSLFPRITDTSQKDPEIGVVIGKITKVESHPNADKLNIYKVDVGEKTLNIVCGDQSLKQGQLVPVALPGTKLTPNNQKSIKVRREKIRGTISEGMLCSPAEINQGKDNQKILVLPEKLKNNLGKKY